MNNDFRVRVRFTHYTFIYKKIKIKFSHIYKKIYIRIRILNDEKLFKKYFLFLKK